MTELTATAWAPMQCRRCSHFVPVPDGADPVGCGIDPLKVLVPPGARCPHCRGLHAFDAENGSVWRLTRDRTHYEFYRGEVPSGTV